MVGGDSLVGNALAKTLAERGDVVTATTRRQGRDDRLLFLDLVDSKDVPLPRVDVAIFCAAVTSFERCRIDEPLARRTNVTGTFALARRLVDAGAHAVLLSTAAVFDFQSPHIAAEAPVRPSSAIGKVKAEAEAAFREFGGRASIVRLTKVLTPKTALFVNWMASLWQHQRIVAFTDHHIAPLALDRVTSDLITVCDTLSGGIHQLSGARDISYFDAARFIARRMEVDESYVRGALAIESNILPGEVCRFASLDGSRLAGLTGKKMPDPYDVLEAVYGPTIEAFHGPKSEEALKP